MTEIWPAILAAASAIVLLSNCAEKIGNAIKAAKAPEQKQNDEISGIKIRLDKVGAKLASDKKEIECVTSCNHVLTKGMLALLEHGINGNNIDQMRDAKRDVEAYLINH